MPPRMLACTGKDDSTIHVLPDGNVWVSYARERSAWTNLGKIKNGTLRGSRAMLMMRLRKDGNGWEWPQDWRYPMCIIECAAQLGIDTLELEAASPRNTQYRASFKAKVFAQHIHRGDYRVTVTRPGTTYPVGIRVVVIPHERWQKVVKKGTNK